MHIILFSQHYHDRPESKDSAGMAIAKFSNNWLNNKMIL
jgi:hypothetical protein